MNKLAKFALAAVVAAGMAISAQALDITPATLPQWTGNQTGTAQILAAISPITGGATEQYKQDYGGGESGGLAGSYTTTFADTSNGTITYNGGSIVGATAWLLVKDGKNNPSWYLFNLTTLGWNGTDTIAIKDFWPAQGGISHVSLFGPAGNPPEQSSVADAGTTMALLGLGLGALGLARRKLA